MFSFPNDFIANSKNNFNDLAKSFKGQRIMVTIQLIIRIVLHNFSLHSHFYGPALLCKVKTAYLLNVYF